MVSYLQSLRGNLVAKKQLNRVFGVVGTRLVAGKQLKVEISALGRYLGGISCFFAIKGSDLS
jgi:hypothetical protein